MATVHDYFKVDSRKIYQSSGWQFFSSILAGFPLGILVAFQTFVQMKNFKFALIAFGIYLVVIAVICAFLVYACNRWYALSKFNKILLIGFAIVISTVVFGATYYIYHTVIALTYLGIAYGLTITTSLMAANMRKRSEYGNELLGRIVGLKDFITTAEKDRLDMLVKENPTIFYDILPYAYAFGITAIWSEHFKNLTMEPCSWYTSYGTQPNFYYMTSNINRSMTRFKSDATYIPPTEKSSGGFSSGGGGGFSGGGFGGSGGGGW